VNQSSSGIIDRICDCCNSLDRMVIRGEIPIEQGDSWYTAKTMEVVLLKNTSWSTLLV